MLNFLRNDGNTSYSLYNLMDYRLGFKLFLTYKERICTGYDTLEHGWNNMLLVHC